MTKSRAYDEAGDRGGLAAIYLEHRSAILRLIVARTGNASEAEDIVQELWIRVGASTGPIANPVAYLYRSALNIALDRLRERTRRQRREADWDGARSDQTISPADFAEGRERLRRVAAALERMPPGAARVFRRVRVDGASHAQAAAEFGISVSAVEKHIAAALRHLARTVAD